MKGVTKIMLLVASMYGFITPSQNLGIEKQRPPIKRDALPNSVPMINNSFTRGSRRSRKQRRAR